MRVVLTNDDGCPHDTTSPYIKYLVEAIIKYTNWDLIICVPSSQKSWIGKAYLADQDLLAQFIYTKINHPEDNSFLGPFNSPQIKLKSDPTLKEYALVNGTPASCCDIGLNHMAEDSQDIDLVISGPNVGRNSTALYALSSGTFGGALEACHHGKKSIVLSYAFNEFTTDPANLREASLISVKMIESLYSKWNKDVDFYSINVPLWGDLKLGKTKIYWAPMLENRWGSSLFKKSESNHDDGEMYLWEPDYNYVHDFISKSSHASDGKLVADGAVTVTALKSIYHQVHGLNSGEFEF